MAGYRIHCELMGDTPVIRDMDIPMAVTFLDLHRILQTVFSWKNDGLHVFTAGDQRLAVCRAEDPKEIPLLEEELAVDRLLEEKVPLHYHYDSPEIDFEVTVTLLRKMPRFSKTAAVCQKAEGLLLEAGREEAWSLEEINERLAENPPACLGSSAPTMKDLWKQDDAYSDKQLSDLGLDMKSIFDRQDKRFEENPYIPDSPRAEGKSKAYQMGEKLQDYYEEHSSEAMPVRLGRRTLKETLGNLNKTELFDYCKYTHQLEVLQKSDEERLDALCRAYTHDPRLILYPFRIEDVDPLLAAVEGAGKGEYLSSEPILDQLVFTGLASFENGAVELAADLPQVLSKLSRQEVEETKRLMERYDEGMRVLMRFYGIIELTAIREMMKKHFQITLNQTRTNQLVYLRYSAQRKIRTFTIYNQVSYAADCDLDLQKLSRSFLFGMSDFYPYAELEERYIGALKKDEPMAFMDIFPGWSYLNALLLMNARMSQENASDVVLDFYQEVRSDATLQEMLGKLQVNFQGLERYGRVRLWEIFLHFVVGTGLPSLKGASRIEVCRDLRYSMTLPMVNFIEGEVSEKDIRKDTPIDVFPSQLQMEIGSRLYTLEESDLPALRKLLRLHPDNDDLLYLVGQAHQRLGHFKEAIGFFRDLQKRLGDTGDRSVSESIRMAEEKNPDRPISIYYDGMVKM